MIAEAEALRTIRFRNDKQLRDKLFTPENYAHPAKGNLYMWQEMISLYSKEGDTVLDVFGGVGATLLAALYGRNAVLVELESHFIAPMRASWEKMRQNPMLGYGMGDVLILQGDARALPLGSADAIVTSPPYEDNLSSHDPAWLRAHPEASSGHFTKAMLSGYTRPAAIITSPPYGEAQTGGGIVAAMCGKGDYNVTISLPSSVYSPESHGQGTGNIGNERGTAYWLAMKAVYAECYRILRPGGIMALVLKGFTRDHKYVDLPGQTKAMLLETGWLPHDHWRRELWGMSFWRILQKRKSPDTFDDRLNYEEIIAVRKPE